LPGPLGCTEQHAGLSLSTDSILAEQVAVEAAEPLGVPVFPVVAYGITPSFRAYPGTVSLRVSTYGAIVHDILDCLAEQGFRRILFVNGHGGNAPGQPFAEEWVANRPGVLVAWHNWWNAPKTFAKVMSIDPEASHASWMENFLWTRLPGVDAKIDAKPMVDYGAIRGHSAKEVRDRLGDGSFGGLYQRPDAEMDAIWEVAVAETRVRIEQLG
jgi:creatinine amidohydrolase